MSQMSEGRSYTSEGTASRASHDFAEHGRLDAAVRPATPDAATAAPLTDEDLNKPVVLTLAETPVIWLLDLPGTWMLPDGDEAAAVTASNERYKQRLDKTKTAADLFVQRAAQTLNELRKDKETQASARKLVSAETQFSAHELHDTMHLVHTDPALRSQIIVALVKEAVHRFSRARKQRTKEVSVSIVRLPEQSRDARRDIGFGIVQTTPQLPATIDEQWAAYCRAPESRDSLRTVERLVCQNIHAAAQTLYQRPFEYALHDRASSHTPRTASPPRLPPARRLCRPSSSAAQATLPSACSPSSRHCGGTAARRPRVTTCPRLPGTRPTRTLSLSPTASSTSPIPRLELPPAGRSRTPRHAAARG